MSTTKYKSGRPELLLSEAAERLNCSVNDLIYEAAEGKLTLYVVADFWKIQSVFSLSSSPNVSDMQPYLGMEFNGIEGFTKAIATKMIEGHIEELTLKDNGVLHDPEIYETDIPLGDIGVSFGRKGDFEYLYNAPLVGFVPIATSTVNAFRSGHHSAPIMLDMNKIGNLPDDAEAFFIVPEINISFEDCLNQGRLYVMQDNLLKLSSSEVSDQENQPLNKNGPRDATLEAYADWQRRADEKVEKNPSLSKSAVAELIYNDLEKEKSKHIKAVSTIRQNIEF